MPHTPETPENSAEGSTSITQSPVSAPQSALGKRHIFMAVLAGIFLLTLIGSMIFSTLFNLISGPSFTKKLSTELSKALGAQVTIKKATIAPPAFVVLDSTKIVWNKPEKEWMAISAATLMINCDLQYLIQHPRQSIRYFMSKKSSTTASATLPPFIGSIEARGASFFQGKSSDTTVAARKIHVTMQPKNNGIQGDAFINNVHLASVYTLSDISTKFSFADTTLDIKNFTAQLFEGTISGKSIINVASNKLTSAAISIQKLNLATYYAATKGAGKLSGILNGNVKAGPCPLAADSLIAQAQLIISNLSISELPLQKSLAVSLMLTDFQTLSFEKTTAECRITGSRIDLDTVNAIGNPLSFTTKGYINTQRSTLDQEFHGVLTAAYSAKLPEIVRNSLNPLPGEKRGFDCRVYGALENPKMSIDKKIINRTVQNAFEEVRSGLEKYFR